jgi:hypothetical protein
MDKCVNKVIELHTKGKVVDATRRRFHEWLIDDDLALDKEEAMLRLWNEPIDTTTEDTMTSFLSFQKRLQPPKI